MEDVDWLKRKGYLHISPPLNLQKEKTAIISKIQNRAWVKKHGFFPLLHHNIIERKYKKIPVATTTGKSRSHAKMQSNGLPIRGGKKRPIHYANHIDAAIFSYYASILQKNYEIIISQHEGLHECVTGYRKIPTVDNLSNKSTIHFAHDLFQKIRSNASEFGNCSVLTFDIESFFSSLNHKRLKYAWQKIVKSDCLPEDHYAVFKASTRFSYIYLEDLRKNRSTRSFDERKLARNQINHGVSAWYSSAVDFRNSLKNGEVKLYRYPFRDSKTKIPIGIPQGLPISAVLANIYLLEFDLAMLKIVGALGGGYYKRYSDDIAIVCKPADVPEVKVAIEKLLANDSLTLSSSKSEHFEFSHDDHVKNRLKLRRFPTSISDLDTNRPLTYLGFQFDGGKTLIKSSNLSKFYRRMKQSVKRKANRAKKEHFRNPTIPPYIHRRQIAHLYTDISLSRKKLYTRFKALIKKPDGRYSLRSTKMERKAKGSYLDYVRRASEIMQEPGIARQLRNHKKIFNKTIRIRLTEISGVSSA